MVYNGIKEVHYMGLIEKGNKGTLVKNQQQQVKAGIDYID